MKQKRKVKSLFPQKQKDHTLLITAILLILSLILCIGTAALITSFVGASDDNSEAQPYAFDYDGIKNRAETLYGIRFVDPSNISKTINNIFVESGNLYVSPNPVIVNPANVVGIAKDNVLSGENSHILGGDHNAVESDNVTIIGGTNNDVGVQNNNASILGGDGNKFQNSTTSTLFDKYYKFPLVSVGGKNNSGESVHSKVFVGGSGNKMLSGQGSNLFIIGGENNEIKSNSGSNNMIIGGKNILNHYKKNTFIYSNSDETFTPTSVNAFYLNMEKGVGVNTTGGDKGLYVSGAVYIGDVDISKPCTRISYGVIGSYSGCLVGCTDESFLKQVKWEMLDLGAKCKEICNGSEQCVTTEDTDTANKEENKIYTDAQCTDNVNTGNASICSRDKNFTGGYLEFYKNVIFETVLLDSDQPCPEGKENQCIYKCNSGYHLTGNAENGTLRCYKDCELPWDHTKIKHNETVTAYKRKEAYCSYDSDAQKGPYTCNNYKATLQCDNGVLMVKSSYGSVDNGKTASSVGYKYNECMLNQYRCDTSVYKYSYSDIVDSDKFNDTVSSRITTNRSKTEGMRGIYKLCIDYDAQTQNTVQYLNGDNCFARNYVSTNPKHYTANYQWVGCKPGYHTGEGYENVCMEDCTLQNRDGTKKSYRHKEAVTGYANKTETCPGTGTSCQAANLFCDDGTWKLGSMNGNVDTLHTYNDCVLNAKTCDATYNVTHDEYLSGKAHSYYSTGCESYAANGKACTFTDIRYQLIGCQTGYHMQDNKKRCVEDVKLEVCEAKPANSTWSGSTCYTWDGKDKCTYQNIWTGGWKSGGWDRLYNPNPHCQWTCDDGRTYSESSGECEKDRCKGDGPTGDDNIIIKSNGAPRWNFRGNRTWKYSTGSEDDIKNGSCLWGCKDGYHGSGNTCVANDCNYCAKSGFPYCFPIDFSEDCKEPSSVSTECQVGVDVGASISGHHYESLPITGGEGNHGFTCNYFGDETEGHKFGEICSSVVKLFDDYTEGLRMKEGYQFAGWLDGYGIVRSNELSPKYDSLKLKCGEYIYLSWQCATGYDYIVNGNNAKCEK